MKNEFWLSGIQPNTWKWNHATYATAQQMMLLNSQDKHRAFHLSTLQIGPAIKVPKREEKKV